MLAAAAAVFFLVVRIGATLSAPLDTGRAD
jgi:hypothetical protein